MHGTPETQTTPTAVRPLCQCLRVYEDEVRQTIADGGLTTVRQVAQSACGAGSGCTACHRHIRRLLAEAAAECALEPLLGCA